MKASFFVTLLLCSTFSVSAMASSPSRNVSPPAIFIEVLKALSMPAARVGTVHAGWDEVAAIRGIQWDWPRKEIASHDMSWQGSVGNHLGLRFEGARTTIHNVMVVVDYSFTDSEENEFITFLSHSNNRAVEKLTIHCDPNEEVNGIDKDNIDFYKFTSPGKGPLYITRELGFGGIMAYYIAYDADGSLGAVKERYSCRLLN